MPVCLGPGEQFTATRKVGETTDGLKSKFRSVELPSHCEEEQWKSVFTRDFSQVKPEHFKQPEKWGVMADRMRERTIKIPKPFLGTTSNQVAFNVDANATMQAYSKPLRQAPCEIALKKGPAKRPASYERDAKALRTMLREERQRKGEMMPVERRRDDKNTSLSFDNQAAARFVMGIPSTETTTGRANREGLGEFLP